MSLCFVPAGSGTRMDEAEATTLSIDATTLFTIGDYQEASKLWGKSAGLFLTGDHSTFVHVIKLWRR